MASVRLPLTITAKKDLKPVKTKLRFKKADVRQCRLCLRVLPRGDVRLTMENDAYGFRRKIADAVGVKIKDWDKVQGVCANCLLLVDMINSFRETCRKADTIHRQRLLMMHPGKWTNEESKKMLEDSHSLIKRHRFEMDALFKCFESKEEEDRQRRERKVSPDKGHPASITEGEIPERQDSSEQINQTEEASMDGEDISNDDNAPEWFQVSPDKGHPASITEGEIPERQDSSEQTNQTEEASMDGEYITNDDNGPEQQTQQQEGPEQLQKCLPSIFVAPLPVLQRRKQKSTRNYMCEFCGQLLKGGCSETHYNMFHSKTRPYGCSHPGCTKSYPSKTFLNIHIKKTHRAPAEPLFECPTCTRKIKGKTQFEKHCKTHGAEVHNTEKDACSVCGKFVYKRYLKDHMFVHSGELPYSCEFCDRKYAARTNLSQHRRKHHADQLQPMES